MLRALFQKSRQTNTLALPSSSDSERSRWLVLKTEKQRNPRRILMASIAFIVLGTAFFGTLSQVFFVQAANVYSCPAGTVLQGTNCIAQNKTFSCPLGGNLQNTDCLVANKTFSCPRNGLLSGSDCLATVDTPVDNTSLGCYLGGNRVDNVGYGRGSEPQFASFACAMDADFTFDNGLQDVDPNFAQGVVPPNASCPAPNEGSGNSNSRSFPVNHISFDPNDGFVINRTANYTDPYTINSTIVCGAYDVPLTPLGGGNGQTLDGTFYYWPGLVYSNYSYAAVGACPANFTDAGGLNCAYPATSACPAGWSDAGGLNCFIAANVTVVPDPVTPQLDPIDPVDPSQNTGISTTQTSTTNTNTSSGNSTSNNTNNPNLVRTGGFEELSIFITGLLFLISGLYLAAGFIKINPSQSK